ncbi:MAG: O-antigen biosynthesis protein WbqP [Saprospiraceae bacterium]|jgi:O-antigen biosynthesis protein WbqP
MIRIFDILIAFCGLVVLLPFIIIVLFIGLFDSSKPLFIQERVGRDQKTFLLFKFRTMVMNTVSVGTHEVDPMSITRLGHFLRKYKIDEIPQLFNVIIGEMSIVGPRPCLPVQIEVIQARERKDVFDVRPGITGLAQLREIDMSTPELLAETDQQMIESLSLIKYFNYILLTVVGGGRGDRVKPQ